jgi:hypothetical protein
VRKLLRTLLFAAIFTLCLMPFAHADVAYGWTIPLVAIGVPVLIIAVAVIIIAVVVKALRSGRKDK